MTIAPHTATEKQHSGLSDEAGTAPGDRRFRPDIQGLRAVAVLLVVLYHAGLHGLSGGYVGVDVFFVISGFVITGLLLRERGTSGRTSLIGFYGRRSRRIIPAATLVIIVTVMMTYSRVGVVFGNQTATDARWTAVFLANFHFASIGTNYLTAQLPPSPLQNFWSLAVEEQFYLVYPTLFLLVAGIRTRVSVQTRLFVCLVIVIAHVVHPLGCADGLKSHRRLLLTVHPRLGTRPRCSGGGFHEMAAHHPETRRGGSHLAGIGRHRVRRHRLRQRDRLPRVLGRYPGCGSGAGHRRRDTHAAVGR